MSVTYTIKDVKFNSVCFSDLSYHIKFAKAVQEDYITYYINSKVTKEIFYKYLLFLRQIPLFKKLLKAPKTIVNKDEIILPLTYNALEAFIIFTALRATNEFPKYVEKIASYYPNKTIVTNLELLGTFSYYKYGITNPQHWFCYATPHIKINKEVLIQNKQSILYNGIVKELFKLFSYELKYNELEAAIFIKEKKLNV